MHLIFKANYDAKMKSSPNSTYKQNSLPSIMRVIKLSCNMQIADVRENARGQSRNDESRPSEGRRLRTASLDMQIDPCMETMLDLRELPTFECTT